QARGLPVQKEDILTFLRANSESLDAVIALDVLEHFTKDELCELAMRLHAILTAGGVLVVQTPNGAGLFPAMVADGDFTHMTVFTPSSFRQLFSSVGFVDFSFRETGPVPHSVRGLLRKAVWRLVTSAANAVRMIECGKRQSVWTENMICRCRKGGS
ncbi:MAG: hypothetical protein QHI48_07610, partial [Bacteroidota bacterium]|nr:hypothetical protein [Bacteroidota bacterium]